MWAACHRSLHSSSGGVTATTRASHPIANATASTGRTPRPYPAWLHSRNTPAAYTPMKTTRLPTSIEHPVRDRSREYLKGEESARGEAEHGHEARSLPRPAAVGRDVTCCPRQRAV